jgi:hypothetical protein
MNKYFRFALFPNLVRPVLEKEALILKFQSETPGTQKSSTRADFSKRHSPSVTNSEFWFGLAFSPRLPRAVSWAREQSRF